MRICRVEIERFRGIRELSFTVPSSLQLIAGANNAGKSTVMAALDFFFKGDYTNLDLELIQPKNSYYSKESPRALTKIKIEFTDLTIPEKRDFKDAISPRKKSFWCQIKISRKGEISFGCSQKADAKFLYDRLISKFSVFHIPVLRVMQGGVSNTESQRLMKAVTAVLIRNRPGPKT